MGKKNKKSIEDFFNLSPEEQMANAEMFHDVEKGEASFLDALDYNIPNSPSMKQSSFKRQIEEACLGSLVNEDDKTYCDEVSHILTDNAQRNTTDIDDCKTEDKVEFISYTELYDSMIESGELPDSDNDETNATEQGESEITEDVIDPRLVNRPSNPILMREKIIFEYEPVTGKMLIDDGLVSTPVSVMSSASYDLDPDLIPDDGDALARLFSKIFFFIITCKHPSVIMSEDTFEIEFSLFAKINFKRFVFFKNNGFIYAYVIDKREVDEFYSVVSRFSMDDTETLQYLVASAYAASSIHNTFMYNDPDEVESVMNARHAIKDLIKLIDADSETEYAGHNSSGDVLGRMRVTDLQSFTTDVRSILDDLAGHVLLDDSEYNDDGDNDEYADYEDIDDHPDETDDDDIIDDDLHTDTDDIDAYLEDVESIDRIIDNSINSDRSDTSSADNSESDMVLPIVHRRS